ncbi:MAG: sigma-70 family RNA polymerase sigma factor [Verrucomicrobiales bacterium]|nr:sigma-70 family RNA polymerase sigma factor [Verrucomicrobiales bacterium]
MPTGPGPIEAMPGGSATFLTTQWSMVLSARDAASPGSREALESLCAHYWLPIYAFLRRQHFTPADAEDLVQGFFASLLAHQSLEAVAPERGRFRSFLLAALRNYLSDQRDRERALKRGAGIPPISLDADTAESQYASQVSDGETPERCFERQWAWSVLRRAEEQLSRECRDAGKADLHAALGPQTESGRNESHAAIAARLGMTENAVRVAAFRLRQRFQELVRREIRETVSHPSEVDAEIRHLLEVLANRS